MLEINNLNITYDKEIFKNAHVKFYDSNIHGITGPSGCGKTTLINTILSANKQCQCIYNHKEIDNKEQFILEHIFYVDQYGSYFDNMNIYQHFQFYGELMNEDISEAKIKIFLNKVGLDQVNLKHSPSKLSIGERKRFLIALALFSQRDILIFDEPTASLDKKNISLFKTLLSLLKNQTVILTTHEDELLDICDIVYQIDECQIKNQKENIRETETVLSKHEMKFKCSRYYKYKNKYQWLQQLFLMMTGIFLCVGLGTIVNNEYAIYNGVRGKQYLANDQMIYFRKKHANAQNNMYVFGEEYNSVPLTEQEKIEIENIQGIVSMRNIGTYSVVNPNDTGTSHSIKIFNNGQEKVIDESAVKALRPVVRPYFPENNMDKDNNKIFITNQFAFEQGITKGSNIKLPLYIPTYQYVYLDDSQIYRHISYKNIEMEFKIDNIVTSEESYKSFDTPYIIYIPYQQFEKIMNDHNGEISNNKPRSENVKGMPYSYDDYVIFANRDSIGDVYKLLTEMNEDYDVFSQSVYYSESAKEQSQLEQSQLMILGGIGLVSAIAYLTIYYFQLRLRRNERLHLIYNGITYRDIRNYMSYETGIHFLGWIGISVMIIVMLSSRYIFLNIAIFLLVSVILTLLEHIVIYLTLCKEEKKFIC